MLRSIVVLAACASVLLPACGDQKDETQKAVNDLMKSAGSAVDGAMDNLSKLSPEAIKEKASNLVSDAVAKLGEVKDAATAASTSKVLTPMLDNLGKMKAALGSTKLDFSSLQNAAKQVAAKFTGNASILDALKPILDKINSLTG